MKESKKLKRNEKNKGKCKGKRNIKKEETREVVMKEMKN
jgi:hypothetical protein